MKTKRVRPILIESKERTDIWWSGSKLYYNRTPEEPITPCYELILISLEDEEIEVGDEVYIELAENSRLTKVISLNRKHSIFTIEIEEGYAQLENLKKVIAHQDEISPKDIAKFVEQYNNGCVEDLEIEMTIVTICFIYFYQYWGIKLTDDFVTIVEKEPITYTEDEVNCIVNAVIVKFMCSKRQLDFPISNKAAKFVDNWIENKKTI